MKKGHTHKDFFYPTNPSKCGGQTPYYRSSWELTFMRLCDTHPEIIRWASEPIKIPYQHPFTGKFTVYVPDFIIVILQGGIEYTQIIEIKPKKETYVEAAKDVRSQQRLVVNRVKWAACNHYAESRGMIFKVLTEDQIFG